MPTLPSSLKLTHNPFEPAATGAPLSGAPLFVPETLSDAALKKIDALQTGPGVKGIVVVGEYGSGKTCLLRWLEREVFPARHIRTFYFDNPGVHFYDLANRLLRTVGRKDFAKFIWELAGSHVDTPYPRRLFQTGYEEYIGARRPQDVTAPLQDAIMAAGITNDEQIAHCLARIVTESVRQPYFDYRDFVPGARGSVVPEGEEAPYFRSILKTIKTGLNASGTAFVIDEFEEIGLQKRLTRRAAHDYLATLKRLMNLAHHDTGIDFWLVLSMTPDAYETSRILEPAGFQRMEGGTLYLEPLSWPDASDLLLSRVRTAALGTMRAGDGSLFPFPPDPGFRATTYNNPRRLVQVCFRAIAHADETTAVPFESSYLRAVEDELYPPAESEKDPK